MSLSFIIYNHLFNSAQKDCISLFFIEVYSLLPEAFNTPSNSAKSTVA